MPKLYSPYELDTMEALSIVLLVDELMARFLREEKAKNFEQAKIKLDEFFFIYQKFGWRFPEARLRKEEFENFLKYYNQDFLTEGSLIHALEYSEEESDISFFHIASYFGYSKAVMKLLEADETMPLDENFYIALMLAVKKGHYDVVKILINYEWVFTQQKKQRWVEILLIAGNFFCDIAGVARYVEQDSYNHDKALILASRSGHFDTVELLIENSVDISFSGKALGTALYEAVFMGFYDIVELLIKNGANVNLKLGSDLMPLTLAIVRCFFDIVTLLINNGAVINHEDSYNKALTLAIQQGNFDAVEYLVKNGVDIDRADANGDTPLIMASNMGDYKIAELLLKWGADANSVNSNRDTPLLIAVKRLDYKLTELLLKSGADIDPVGLHKNTPLLIAAQNGNYMYAYKIVELLIKWDADINRVDNFTYSALDYALRYTSSDIAALLIGHGALANQGKKRINSMFSGAMLSEIVGLPRKLIEICNSIYSDKDFASLLDDVNLLFDCERETVCECIRILLDQHTICFNSIPFAFDVKMFSDAYLVDVDLGGVSVSGLSFDGALTFGIRNVSLSEEQLTESINTVEKLVQKMQGFYCISSDGARVFHSDKETRVLTEAGKPTKERILYFKRLYRCAKELLDKRYEYNFCQKQCEALEIEIFHAWKSMKQLPLSFVNRPLLDLLQGDVKRVIPRVRYLEASINKLRETTGGFLTVAPQSLEERDSVVDNGTFPAFVLSGSGKDIYNAMLPSLSYFRAEERTLIEGCLGRVWDAAREGTLASRSLDWLMATDYERESQAIERGDRVVPLCLSSLLPSTRMVSSKVNRAVTVRDKLISKDMEQLLSASASCFISQKNIIDTKHTINLPAGSTSVSSVLTSYQPGTTIQDHQYALRTFFASLLSKSATLENISCIYYLTEGHWVVLNFRPDSIRDMLIWRVDCFDSQGEQKSLSEFLPEVCGLTIYGHPLIVGDHHCLNLQVGDDNSVSGLHAIKIVKAIEDGYSYEELSQQLSANSDEQSVSTSELQTLNQAPKDGENLNDFDKGKKEKHNSSYTKEITFFWDKEASASEKQNHNKNLKALISKINEKLESQGSDDISVEEMKILERSTEENVFLRDALSSGDTQAIEKIINAVTQAGARNNFNEILDSIFPKIEQPRS